MRVFLLLLLIGVVQVEMLFEYGCQCVEQVGEILVFSCMVGEEILIMIDGKVVLFDKVLLCCDWFLLLLQVDV